MLQNINNIINENRVDQREIARMMVKIEIKIDFQLFNLKIMSFESWFWNLFINYFQFCRCDSPNDCFYFLLHMHLIHFRKEIVFHFRYFILFCFLTCLILLGLWVKNFFWYSYKNNFIGEKLSLLSSWQKERRKRNK